MTHLYASKGDQNSLCISVVHAIHVIQEYMCYLRLNWKRTEFVLTYCK